MEKRLRHAFRAGRALPSVVVARRGGAVVRGGVASPGVVTGSPGPPSERPPPEHWI